MDYKNPTGIIRTETVPKGTIRWKSPSNIALIKYWGKFPVQMPRNPSISFTLDAAYTETTLKYSPRKDDHTGIDLKFYFEGSENQAFSARIEKFLTSLIPIFPFLRQLSLEIHSKNSFPHSSGIASSASSMSALALCLCTLEEQVLDLDLENEEFDRKASYVARLGSGSACRSIFSEAALWGKLNDFEGSSDEYAVPLGNELHKTFKGFRDWIFLVSSEKKSVSSSKGHELMDSNDFSEARYVQARKKSHVLLDYLRHGKVEEAGKIIEEEALTLHGLMMCSRPGFILMEPETIELIRGIQRYREDSGVQLYFTLDAGPNVHLLFHEKDEKHVERFITTEFSQYLEPGRIIRDKVGSGPVQLD